MIEIINFDVFADEKNQFKNKLIDNRSQMQFFLYIFNFHISFVVTR